MLTVELKVNGRPIGELHINRLEPERRPWNHYSWKFVKPNGERIYGGRPIRHRYQAGAWRLVKEVLGETPFHTLIEATRERVKDVTEDNDG